MEEREALKWRGEKGEGRERVYGEDEVLLESSGSLSSSYILQKPFNVVSFSFLKIFL